MCGSEKPPLGLEGYSCECDYSLLLLDLDLYPSLCFVSKTPKKTLVLLKNCDLKLW